MSKANDLRISAINRHRKRLFGDSSLKVYSITPAAGEAVVETFAKDCDHNERRYRSLAIPGCGQDELGGDSSIHEIDRCANDRHAAVEDHEDRGANRRIAGLEDPGGS